MKTFRIAIALSATLILAGCGSDAPKETTQHSKPSALMSSEPVSTTPVEAVPMENAILVNGAAEADTATGNHMVPAPTVGTRTIGDRRSNEQ